MTIDTHTKLCCIIGNPVEHSLSPKMHNAAYKKLGLNYIFLAFRVTDLKKAMEGLKTIGVTGISVTIPHKVAVLNYADQADEVAAQIGAANIILNKDGRFIATNTDWIGALKALEEKTVVKGKRVAILGDGGAARAVIYGLKKQGTYVSLFNRNKAKAYLLQREFHLENSYQLTDYEKIKKNDIIINTTSVGMIPDIDISPIPIECINSHQVVFDIVYTPNETKLLQYAKAKKATVVYGHKMLLYGVAKQFELFTGEKAPLKIMERSLINNLRLQGRPLRG